MATLVNVSTVLPQRQQELVGLLVEATEQVMRHQPGVVSAIIRVGLDGTRVFNYAQWASTADCVAMMEDPSTGEHRRRSGRSQRPSTRTCTASCPFTTPTDRPGTCSRT